MPESNLLIVAIDGLRASALGAYGNTTFPTPALDEFAAESFLFDNFFAPSADLQAIYRALWHSHHPLRPSDFATADKPLPQWFADCGFETILVTDEPQLAAHAASAGFAKCTQIDGTANERAADVSQITLARLFAATCEAVGTNDRRRLVWVHSSGMSGPWDVPLELQDSLRDEGDPPPVESIDPPSLNTTSTDDPDTAFRFACAYAAQVMVLDACWESLLGTLQASETTDDWLVSLLGVRGFPLGEHHRIGGIDDRLYVEQLHTPWLIRFPDGRGRLARTGAIASHLDLLPTLTEWNDGLAKSQSNHRDGANVLPLIEKLTAPWREAVLSTSTVGHRAIRTPGWSFCRGPNAEIQDAASFSANLPSGELFVRPDDRWESNDIAGLCSEVATGLSQVIDAWSEQLLTGQPFPLTKLPDELRAFAT